MKINKCKLFNIQCHGTCTRVHSSRPIRYEIGKLYTFLKMYACIEMQMKVITDAFKSINDGDAMRLTILVMKICIASW